MMYMLPIQILLRWNYQNKAKITQIMLIYVPPRFVFVIVARPFLSHLFFSISFTNLVESTLDVKLKESSFSSPVASIWQPPKI